MKQFAWQKFLTRHHSRWFLIALASGAVCALAAALVLAQTSIFPSRSIAVSCTNSLDSQTPAISDHFLEERLQAFSGHDFNLLPDLSDLVNLFDQSLARIQPVSAPGFARQLAALTDPAYISFSEYTIRHGENYWLVAKQHGFTIDSIVGCNPNLEKTGCFVGQKICLPSRGGCLHQVKPGETLATIALDYRGDPESIRLANRLGSDWSLTPGMWLFIPGAKPLYLTQAMHQQYSTRALFRSPLAGRYTSFVGRRIHPVLGFSKYHNGVDISCKWGSWVGAAAAGTVIQAGEGGAIGKFVKIDHHNGYQTLYGHLSRIYVRSGQNVAKGKLIALSGSTGRSTGPHLHFTIWENGVVKNPMKFLW